MNKALIGILLLATPALAEETSTTDVSLPPDSWKNVEFNLNYVVTRNVAFGGGAGAAYTPQLYGVIPYAVFAPRLDLQLQKDANGFQIGVFGLGFEMPTYLWDSFYVGPGFGLGVAVQVRESITYGFPYFSGVMGYRINRGSDEGLHRRLERIVFRYRYLPMHASAHEAEVGIAMAFP